MILNVSERLPGSCRRYIRDIPGSLHKRFEDAFCLHIDRLQSEPDPLMNWFCQSVDTEEMRR